LLLDTKPWRTNNKEYQFWFDLDLQSLEWNEWSEYDRKMLIPMKIKSFLVENSIDNWSTLIDKQTGIQQQLDENSRLTQIADICTRSYENKILKKQMTGMNRMIAEYDLFASIIILVIWWWLRLPSSICIHCCFSRKRTLIVHFWANNLIWCLKRYKLTLIEMITPLYKVDRKRTHKNQKCHIVFWSSWKSSIKFAICILFSLIFNDFEWLSDFDQKQVSS
jgi:hypothetical protein